MNVYKSALPLFSVRCTSARAQTAKRLACPWMHYAYPQHASLYYVYKQNKQNKEPSCADSSSFCVIYFSAAKRSAPRFSEARCRRRGSGYSRCS